MNQVVFEFLGCVSYTFLEEAVKKLNNEGEYERYSLEEFGNNTIGEQLVLIGDDQRADAIATFVLSGVGGDGYIMRCVSVDSLFSLDGQYHS